MAATILPFPLARRVSYVRKQADHLTIQQTARAAENILNHQLARQREALLRKGVAPALVEIEVASLEEAILAEANHLTYAPGGVRA